MSRRQLGQPRCWNYWSNTQSLVGAARVVSAWTRSRFANNNQTIVYEALADSRSCHIALGSVDVLIDVWVRCAHDKIVGDAEKIFAEIWP